MLIAIAAVVGALFGATVVSEIVAIGGRKGACGDCAAWEMAVKIRIDIAADLERQLDLLIEDAFKGAEEFQW